LFNEYEGVVAREGSKMLPMDGTIHPLTAQVLSYIKVKGGGLFVCTWGAGIVHVLNDKALRVGT
jgi:hypothetical protein